MVYSLPDVAEDFAADAPLARLTISQDTARGRKDGDAQAVANLRNVTAANVYAPGRLAYTLETTNDALVVGIVLGEKLDRTLGAGIDLNVALDKTLILEDLNDLKLDV
jgi:hypothetical protein